MIEAARKLLMPPPSDSGAFRRALILTDRASRLRQEAPHQQLVHGMALYRNGRYEDALRALAEVPPTDKPLARVFTAMALHHQGHDAAARGVLDPVADQLHETDKPYLDEARKLVGE
jgi:hypothetical protein